MRSMRDIMCAVVDGEINTKEQASALVTEESLEVAAAQRISIEAARTLVLHNIGYCTGYYDHASADKIMELFETEHPIFGKTHPTPEEAWAKGLEMGAASRDRKEKS